MPKFMDDHFLLTTRAARRLYHDHARGMPILDFHCHLPVRDIAENHAFRSLTEAWLAGDHYKWRAMRACGELGDFKASAAEEVRRTAYKIIEAKGSTCYAIGQAASVIVDAIVRDERRILPVSTAREDFNGTKKTAFSFPSIVGRDGVVQVLKFPLAAEENERLAASAKFVAENIARAGY